MNEANVGLGENEDITAKVHVALWPKNDMEAFESILNQHPEVIDSKFGKTKDTLMIRQGNFYLFYSLVLNLLTFHWLEILDSIKSKLLNILLQKTYQNVIVLFMPEVESLKNLVYDLHYIFHWQQQQKI